ncbi:hypothetical protein OJ40_23405 [Salmonella enterica subsp. enterica]|uniref:Uncharacterized protein n=1 Tax=Salmonella enterica subsp. diarizonae serovar 48:i:z TaxID=1192842 RepID=A0A735VWQ3_SALDZ|nr:hypothetical protein [Salmonella enterica]EBP3541475.1 hypothetical protein [Salmonella enterica subsp. enterica]HAE7123012.1 hypothetical protein [Salmonella enterica subsp. diarizonae serovar 48:i:z]EBI4653592.1 hypothetical protein [Salmonella enterica]EJP3177206.1 hypothetical protein [Salmonella enterica]
MNEPVLVYSRQWPVTAALTALLSRVFSVRVIPLYTKGELICHLNDNPRSSLVLGLSPHEYVVALYGLYPLLSGRGILFVARRFYWTDYRLPEFFGMTPYRFCTWDELGRVSWREYFHWFRRLSAGENQTGRGEVGRFMTSGALLKTVNKWLYSRMEEWGLGLTGSVVLLLLAESRRVDLNVRELSMYRTGGLRKLGMTKHISCLYRGVQVRSELQMALQANEPGHTTAVSEPDKCS